MVVAAEVVSMESASGGGGGGVVSASVACAVGLVVGALVGGMVMPVTGAVVTAGTDVVALLTSTLVSSLPPSTTARGITITNRGIKQRQHKKVAATQTPMATMQPGTHIIHLGLSPLLLLEPGSLRSDPLDMVFPMPFSSSSKGSFNSWLLSSLTSLLSLSLPEPESESNPSPDPSDWLPPSFLSSSLKLDPSSSMSEEASDPS
mmetsp:Transcript_22017/g.61262  ORF Transcript_22017/g.61262 Transcript_22017/m.61262 type:complete len:204 (-) Transcript_22017:610-1221(-)